MRQQRRSLSWLRVAEELGQVLEDERQVLEQQLRELESVLVQHVELQVLVQALEQRWRHRSP
jgi:hypothetical protein